MSFAHTLPLSDIMLTSVKSVTSKGLEDTRDTWQKCTCVQLFLHRQQIFIHPFINQEEVFFKKTIESK